VQIVKQVTSLIKSALTNLNLVNDLKINLEHPADSKFGDYSCNVAMLLFKQQDKFKNPRDLAQAIVDEIINHQPSNISHLEVAGPGFINFYLSDQYFLENLSQNTEVKKINSGKTAVVEYSSPNIAKPFTIGHLRSTIIGDAVANLLEATSYEVKRDNHLGDWGTQFGKMIYALLHLGAGNLEKNLAKIKNSSQPVKELVNLYVDFHKQAEVKPAMDDEARAWFLKLEQGDAEAKQIWQTCIDLSWIEFDRIYSRLQVKFSENHGRGYGESYFEDKMQVVLDELKEKKLLVESEGAQLVFFPQEKYPPLMLVKKDGATLYATRDLATDNFRLKKYGSEILIVNEVGAEQSLYFKQIFEVEKMLAWVKDGQRVHVGHGLYRFKDKKMSTRKGEVIWLEDVLNEAVSRAGALAKNKLAAASTRKIAIGALKWNDLKRSAHLDVVFDFDEILSMDGNSGPYLQYAYVRAKSVLDLAPSFNLEIKNIELENAERELLKQLSKFAEVVTKSATDYAPHHLCIYLFDLAQRFNSFYHACPILQAEPEKKNLRLALTQTTAQILQQGLNLLGIETVDKM